MSPPAKKMAKPPAATTSGQVAATAPLQHKRIARLAYAYWEARGRPHGSPEEDWFRAEEEIRRRKAGWKIVKDRRHRLPKARISSRGRKSAG